MRNIVLGFSWFVHLTILGVFIVGVATLLATVTRKKKIGHRMLTLLLVVE